MRKFALVAAAALMAAAGSAVKADFVFQTIRTPVTTGIFAGDEQVVLQIEQGSGTAATGNIISTVTSLSSIAAQPKFFIRTWNAAGGGWDTGDNVTPGSNADFGNQGTLSVDTTTPRTPAGVGSNVKLIGATNTVLATTPSETATTYTDGQAVSGFSVTDGIGGTTGAAVTTFKTIATAIVPVGQEVTFSGTASAAGGTAPDQAFVVQDPTVPEPASLAFAGIGGLGLLARRRRSA